MKTTSQLTHTTTCTNPNHVAEFPRCLFKYGVKICKYHEMYRFSWELFEYWVYRARFRGENPSAGGKWNAVLGTHYLSFAKLFLSAFAATTPEPMCECDCEYYSKLQKWDAKAEEEAILKITPEEKQEEAVTELKETKKKLAVNTTKLSSNTRKYISAQDTRTSAQGIGYIGAVFLGLVGVSVVLCDLISVKQHIQTIQTGVVYSNKKKYKK